MPPQGEAPHFSEERRSPLDKDPKEFWAERNKHLFPIEINTADYELLVRVPGVGKVMAEEIIKRRKEKALTKPEDLRGIRNAKKVLKYVTMMGRYFS